MPAVRLALALAACGAAPLAARAADVPVYGGPLYSPTAGGLRFPYQSYFPGKPLGGGAAATGSAEAYGATGEYLGTRAARLTAGNAVGEVLGVLGTTSAGYTLSTAYGVNGAGTAVGTAVKYVGGSDLGRRAVRWGAGTTAATELGNLGTSSAGLTQSAAHAVNPAGTAVGWADRYDAGNKVGSKAVRWDAGGTAATELGGLGTPNAAGSASAYAVNAAGTAVGYAERFNAAGVYQGQLPARWAAGGTTAVELGTLGADSGGRANGIATAVNDSGTAVGYSESYGPGGQSRGRRAVRWEGTTTAATPLGVLGTNAAGSTEVMAYAVNASGTAVGYATRYGPTGGPGGYAAVRWDAGGSAATQLEPLNVAADGSAQATAYAVNDAGFVVGFSARYDVAGTEPDYRAVYWAPGGTSATDLNTLIDPAGPWTLRSANGINGDGWVTGVGTYDPDGPGGQAGYNRLFLLQVPTNVPEPSLAAAGLLLATATVCGRRRRFGRRPLDPARVGGRKGLTVGAGE